MCAENEGKQDVADAKAQLTIGANPGGDERRRSVAQRVICTMR